VTRQTEHLAYYKLVQEQGGYMREIIRSLPILALALTGSACDKPPSPASLDESTAIPIQGQLTLQDQKLASISAFVNKICQAPEQGGYRTESDLHAAAEIKGKLLVAKIAEIKFKPEAGIKSVEWRGVDQKNLSDAMRDSRSCAPKTLELILGKIAL